MTFEQRNRHCSRWRSLYTGLDFDTNFPFPHSQHMITLYRELQATNEYLQE